MQSVIKYRALKPVFIIFIISSLFLICGCNGDNDEILPRNAVICRGCYGDGQCSRCGGKGWCFLPWKNDDKGNCRRCGGSGVCPGCDGAGVLVVPMVQD